MTNKSTVMTWRERLGFGSDFPLHAATNVERAMEAEIAELRAILQQRQAPALERVLTSASLVASNVAELARRLRAYARNSTQMDKDMLAAAQIIQFDFAPDWIVAALLARTEHSDGMIVTAHPLPQAAHDVLTERRRQVEQENWSHGLDDLYEDRQLAVAAACYVVNGLSHKGTVPPKAWPWPWHWWKPTDERRNLVRASALLLAEIERRDRASGVKTAVPEPFHEGGAA